MSGKMTLTPKECAEILSANGFGIGYDKLLEGMRFDSGKPKECKIFPFAEAFKMQSGYWAFIIYKKMLADFIAQRGGQL